MATLTIGSTANSRPYGVLTVTETATSTASNTSTLSIKLVLKRPSSITSSATKTASATINGTKYTWSGTIGGSGDKTLISKTQTVTHNSDGKKTITIAASIDLDITWGGVALGTISGSASMALTNIPRYATVSQSLTSRTETTAVIKWTSDSTIDYIWYSINNGSTWTGINIADGTNGSYTISSLAPETTYKVKTRVRRKDSQLTTDSSALNVTTYAYPYANSMPNFTIGNKLTIGLFNPLGRSVTVVVYGADNSQISSDTTTWTSIAGYNGTTVVNKLLASIPNAKNGTYKVKVTYGSASTTKTGGTYTVNNNTVPKIGTVSYVDTNSTVTAITGNNKLIVQNKSTVSFTATGLSAGTSATLKKCVVTVNGNSYTLTISGTTATGGSAVIDSGNNVTATFSVTDSRGMTATKTVTVTMLPWALPTAIIDIQRQSNYYSDTDINVNADFASINGANTVTIRCRYKKVGTSGWSSWTTLQDEVTSTITLDNAFEWNVQIQVTDLFGTTTYNVLVPLGMPIVYYDVTKHSTGFNCFPQDELSVEIDGVNIVKQLFYSSGETLTLSGIPINGLVSTSTSVARFHVPVGKSLAKISSITVTALKGGIRSATGGYFNNGSDSYDWFSYSGDISITATKAAEHNVQLIISITPAFTNTTNNTPCSMYVNTLTLAFS